MPSTTHLPALDDHRQLLYQGEFHAQLDHQPIGGKGDPVYLRNFLEFIKSEGQPLDFEQIMPSPEIMRHARQVYSPLGPRPQLQYFIDDIQSHDFTPDEEKELEALGYRSWEDWAFANWGTNKIAFGVKLDERTVDLGYVVIRFETAWSPPVRILERLREMFPDIAFGCEWFAEEDFFYRYDPSQSTAIARAERERPGARGIATLYLTKAQYPNFFVETRPIGETGSEYREIKPMTRGEAHEWMLAPDVKLLALLYPELSKAAADAVGRDLSSANIADQPIAAPDDQTSRDDIP